jgi:hypothetical protein
MLGVTTENNGAADKFSKEDGNTLRPAADGHSQVARLFAGYPTTSHLPTPPIAWEPRRKASSAFTKLVPIASLEGLRFQTLQFIDIHLK